MQRGFFFFFGLFVCLFVCQLFNNIISLINFKRKKNPQ